MVEFDREVEFGERFSTDCKGQPINIVLKVCVINFIRFKQRIRHYLFEFSNGDILVERVNYVDKINNLS